MRCDKCGKEYPSKHYFYDSQESDNLVCIECEPVKADPKPEQKLIPIEAKLKCLVRAEMKSGAPVVTTEYTYLELPIELSRPDKGRFENNLTCPGCGKAVEIITFGSDLLKGRIVERRMWAILTLIAGAIGFYACVTTLGDPIAIFLGIVSVIAFMMGFGFFMTSLKGGESLTAKLIHNVDYEVQGKPKHELII